jgi:hypothetical protein
VSFGLFFQFLAMSFGLFLPVPHPESSVVHFALAREATSVRPYSCIANTDKKWDTSNTRCQQDENILTDTLITIKPDVLARRHMVETGTGSRL